MSTMNHVIPVESISNKEGRTSYHLGSMLPIDSYTSLFNLFIQFMSNKLTIGRMIVYGPIDLSNCNEAEAKLFEEYCKTLRELITKYRHNVRGEILKKFTEVTSFSHSYEAYFDYLVEDINSLQTNIESYAYKASLGTYLEKVRGFRIAKNNKMETNIIVELEKLQTELSSLYEALRKFIFQLEKNEDETSDTLQKTECDQQAIVAQREAIDEKYLQVVALSEVGAGLQTRVVRSDRQNRLIVCGTEKVTQFYENQQDQILASLASKNKLIKQGIAFNSLIANWLKKLTALLAAIRKMDEFWISVEENISHLEQFITENKANATALDGVINQLEADRGYFDTLGTFAYQLETRTTAEILSNESNVDSLELSFLFKEITPALNPV